MGLAATQKVAIVGAGPCGLACGRELERLGHRVWTVYERAASAGGHARSVVDPQGFTWDEGGHVVFSQFGEFDALFDEVMGADVSEHERSSYVRFDGAWVPYPFQNNLRYLPSEVTYECLVGLVEAPGGNSAMDFATWTERTFGPGITKHFMRPYNLKVWATPPEGMASNWIAERVSVVDYRRALRSVLLQEDDRGWGPNSTFKFPVAGGTGEIYRRLADRLGERVVFGRDVVEVDAAERRLIFADGSAEEYGALVSTMPVDCLVASLRECPDAVRAAAPALEHTGVLVVGVGFEQPLRDDKSWMYFPGDEAPFYRATNFAKYAAANVPGGDVSRYCSFLTETSYSRHRAKPGPELEKQVLAGLRAGGLVDGDTQVASIHTLDAGYAYPVPTVDRDRALETIQPWLMERGIYSRGRFGSWRYEIGNMDHAVKMGIDVARLLVRDTPEQLWS